MARNRDLSKGSIDWIALTIYLALLIIGWMMLYAVVYEQNDQYAFLNFNTIIGKQSIWILIAMATFAIVYSIDWQFWQTFSFPIYGFAMFLLVLVLVIGTEIKGAKSWFAFGGVSFQPSEIAKFATALAMSNYLSSYKSDLRTRSSFFISLGLILLPIILVILQPDPGSALIYMSFFILFYRRGLSGLFYILGFSVVTIFISSLIFDPKMIVLISIILGFGILMYEAGNRWMDTIVYVLISLLSILFYFRDLYIYGLGLLIMGIVYCAFLLIRDREFRIPSAVILTLTFTSALSFAANPMIDNLLKPHQQERVNVWLRPEMSDPFGPRYNITQSKLAIGSGGIEGKGFLEGEMTKLNYVPEQTTDFIFSTVGEEQGFIGSFAVIFLFILLLTRIVVIAERATNTFVQNYAYAVAGIIFLHFFINIGMTMGIMPVIGIPLPFLSKGGSALLGFSIMIAALLRMDKARFR